MPKTAFIAALCLALMADARASAAEPPRLALAGKVDIGRTIAIDADVGCDAERSYRMWSTSDGARSFFAPDAEIGGVGGPYRIVFFPADDPAGLVHGTAGAHVLAAEPNRFYAFEWVVFAGDRLKGDNAPPYADAALRRPDPLPTWVEITVTPAGAGSHVAFRHFGFLDMPAYRQSQAWFTRAWHGVLASMQASCAAAH